MEKLVSHNNLYIVTVSVVSNFIKRENALGTIETWDFECSISVNVINGLLCNEV